MGHRLADTGAGSTKVDQRRPTTMSRGNGAMSTGHAVDCADLMYGAECQPGALSWSPIREGDRESLRDTWSRAVGYALMVDPVVANLLVNSVTLALDKLYDELSRDARARIPRLSQHRVRFAIDAQPILKDPSLILPRPSQ